MGPGEAITDGRRASLCRALRMLTGVKLDRDRSRSRSRSYGQGWHYRVSGSVKPWWKNSLPLIWRIPSRLSRHLTRSAGSGQFRILAPGQSCFQTVRAQIAASKMKNKSSLRSLSS